jgi:hypothetical protein
MKAGLIILLSVVSLLVLQDANAQDCTPQILAQKPGEWKKSPDFSPNVPVEILSKAKAVVTPLSKLFFEVYPQPKGCIAKWYESYGSGTYDIGLAQSYEFIAYFMMYYCKGNGKDFFVGSETDDWTYIMANYCGYLNDFLTVNGKKYWTMKRPTKVKDGMLYYEYPSSSSNPDVNGLWVYAWLITYSGKLPYIPVTRKEYLLEARQEVAKTEIKVIADVKKYTTIRPAAEQEAAKQKELAYLKKSYPDNPRRWQRYLEDYQTDEQRLQMAVDKMTKQYEATLAIMDNLLKTLSEEELQKPAVVSVIATAFTGFEDDFKERNANMLIRWNPDYFNKKLSRAAPQFFTVFVRESRRDIPAVEITRLFKQKFRFEVLSSMLGK